MSWGNPKLTGRRPARARSLSCEDTGNPGQVLSVRGRHERSRNEATYFTYDILHHFLLIGEDNLLYNTMACIDALQVQIFSFRG